MHLKDTHILFQVYAAIAYLIKHSCIMLVYNAQVLLILHPTQHSHWEGAIKAELEK